MVFLCIWAHFASRYLLIIILNFSLFITTTLVSSDAPSLFILIQIFGVLLHRGLLRYAGVCACARVHVCVCVLPTKWLANHRALLLEAIIFGTKSIDTKHLENLGIHISCVFIFLKPSHFVGFVMRWLNYGENHSNQQADYLPTYWRSGSVTRGSGLRSGNCGFDPRPSPTKDFQNGISFSFVCAQH